MALDFLLNLLSTAPRIASNFRGDATPYLPQQEALAGKQAAMGDALLDPNNPFYKQQYGAARERNAASMAETIAEAQRQNRKATKLGRTPLFSAERGGETLFRSLMSGYQGLNQQADKEARAGLMGAADAYGAGLGAYNKLTPYGASRNLQRNLGFQGIADVLRGSGSPSYVPGGINWNSERLDPSQFYR